MVIPRGIHAVAGSSSDGFNEFGLNKKTIAAAVHPVSNKNR
jgi:hypothetical protein